MARSLRIDRDREELFALRAIVIELLRLKSPDPGLLNAIRAAVKSKPLGPPQEVDLVRREAILERCEQLLNEADPFLPHS
jgi:hypothetical protein